MKLLLAFCAAGLVILNEYRWRKKDNRHLSFRAVVVSVLILLGLAVSAHARPSPYPPVTPFVGDRYGSAQLGPEVVKSAKAKQGAKARRVAPTHRLAPPRKRPPGLRQVPIFAPLASVPPISLGEGVRLEASRVIGGRPQGCPRLFCGCGASLHLFGKIIPALNLAANWLRFPRAAPAPNMAAARRGHVFVLKQHIAGNTWLVFDANSGRGRIRIHPRSIAGYQIVNPHGGRS